jgi:hypothetical protein
MSRPCDAALKRSSTGSTRLESLFFRPFGAESLAANYPRLAPWAVILRRFAAVSTLRRFAAVFEAILPLSNSRLSCDTDCYGTFTESRRSAGA